MSYDLYFTKPEITLQQFEDYFRRRDNYKVENAQAWYENEDTGVYFCFEFSDEDSKDLDFGKISFNLNFFRPHFFALEAEIEVKEFIDKFGFSINDPQNEGMAEGPFTKEGFIRGWNYGNEFGYRSILNSDDPPEVIHHRPTNELYSIWQWNHQKSIIQDRLGENIFVPRIMFVVLENILTSVVVWPDAISTLIPQVDALIIPRSELAPKRFFKKKDDICILQFDKVLNAINQYKTDNYCIPSYSLSYESTPTTIKSFIEGPD